MKKKKKERGEKGRAKQSEIKKKNMEEYLLILYTLNPLTSPWNLSV